MSGDLIVFVFFFFNDTATTEIYTLSLHDALPICGPGHEPLRQEPQRRRRFLAAGPAAGEAGGRRQAIQRSEEHTSELQSRLHLVCRLLLEKKKKILAKQILSLLHNYMYPLLYHLC